MEEAVSELKVTLQPAQELYLKADERYLEAEKECSQTNMLKWMEEIAQIREYDGTDMSMIYKFNQWFYFVLTIQSLVGVYTMLFQKNVMRVGLLCISSLYTPMIHLTMVIMTFVYARMSEADICSTNDAMYNEKGNTFSEDLTWVRLWASIQLAGFFVYTACTIYAFTVQSKE